MSTQPLSDAEIAKALTDLPGWSFEAGELVASYSGVREQIPAFYGRVAGAEDAANHHARVTIVYGTIAFALNTHDAGGAITVKDTELAGHITALAEAYGLVPSDN